MANACRRPLAIPAAIFGAAPIEAVAAGLPAWLYLLAAGGAGVTLALSLAPLRRE